jgi:coenzyme F420-0:L-glutamate ligase/coenzyme F420-1:gamma-L-glutamate ligase
MSLVTDTIKTRRSIRKYLPRLVSTEILKKILEAARWAPSAHNAQPWRFILLIDKSPKLLLAEAMADAWMVDMVKDGTRMEVREKSRKASIERFARAPLLVIACVTMKDMIQYTDESRQKCEHDLAVQSLGAAIQNMLLTAHANGLGACWFSAPIFCKETVRKVLEIPKNAEPQALIALGYPAEKPRAPYRKSLQNYSYASHWGTSLHFPAKKSRIIS